MAVFLIKLWLALQVWTIKITTSSRRQRTSSWPTISRKLTQEYYQSEAMGILVLVYQEGIASSLQPIPQVIRYLRIRKRFPL